VGEDKFGPNGMEKSMHKIHLRAFQREPNASAVSLGSLAPANMREVPGNWPEFAESKRAQSLPFRHFYKGWGKKTNLGKMAWKQAFTNLISEHFSGSQMLLQLV